MVTIPTPEGRIAPNAELVHAPYRKFGVSTLDEFLVELRGIQGIKAYNEMRRSDPSVGTALRAIKEVIGQTRWQAVPGGDAKADQDASAFLWTCVEDMSETWADFVTDALTCLDFGWSVTEVVYKLRRGLDADPPSLYDDGRIGWRKFVLVPHDTLDPVKGWQYDEKGGIEGLWQQVMTDKGTVSTFIPIEKALLFRMDRERNNPEGVSMLRTAYRSWFYKKNLEDIEAIGAERDATGTLVISLPVGATTADRNAARSILERYKADDMLGFIRPRNGPAESDAFGFELLGSPGARQYNTNDIIKRYSYEIIRSFLAQFLMLGESNRGSQALSRDHRDLFHMSLRAILQNLAATINRFAVRPLFRYNKFEGLTALPTLQPGRILPGALDSFANAMKTLVETGLIVPDKPVRALVREVAELPPEAEAEEAKPEELKPEEGEREAAEAADEDALDRPDPRILDDDAWPDLEWESDGRLRETERQAREAKEFARPQFDYSRLTNSHADTFRRAMGRLSDSFTAGRIPYDRWAGESKRLVEAHVIDGYRIGRAEATRVYPPSKVQLTRADREAVSRAVGEQLRHFSDFRRGVRETIAAGEPLTSAVSARAQLYGGAVRSAATEARLADVAARLRWVRHKADSCETCLALDGQVRTGRDWQAGGVWPCHGTQCDGNCGCSLEAP